MDEKQTEGTGAMKADDGGNAAQAAEPAAPKTYPMTLTCPNCGHSFNVETPVGRLFPEGTTYTCPTCGFSEYAEYTACQRCGGTGHRHMLKKFDVGRCANRGPEMVEKRGDRR